MSKSDTHIIEKIRKGDKEIFKTLFDVYYHRLMLYAVNYVENRKTAEDIVQDLFYHLWQKRKDIDISTSISSYFFRAVHNRCIQYLRHKKVEKGYEEKQQLKLREAEILYYSGGDYTFSETRFNEIQEIISKSFENLPARTKEIFNMSRSEELKNSIIAKKLGVSIKTVEYHISKALQVFRSALKEFFYLLIVLKIIDL